MKIVADENIPFVKECFSSIGEIELFEGRSIKAENVRDADILLVRSVTKVNGELLGGSNVKFVGTATIGFDHIDLQYLDDAGIGFRSAPGSNANSVAEYVLAGLLELGQKYNFQLDEKSIGIIGVGNVGSRVAAKSRAMGMEVVLNDPPKQRETLSKEYRPLEELFDCDIVTLHTPLTHEGIDKTHHLADSDFFGKLKDDAVFFNTSRGAVADTDAAKASLKCGKLKAAVLDVWENEPAIDIDLLDLVDIGTPHIAGYSFDGKVKGMMMLYEAVCDYFELGKNQKMENFMPEPKISELSLKGSGDEQLEILKAVSRVYDIKADDGRLREVKAKEVSEQGAYFTHLRKTYPVRREFHNTTVRLENENGQLKQKLAGIGFSV